MGSCIERDADSKVNHMDSNDFSLAEDMEAEEQWKYLQTYKQRFLVTL
jgi:hypothetical protein